MVKARLKNARVIIFAGAGASAGLGFPTTPMFVKNLAQEWSQAHVLTNQYRQYLHDIGQSKREKEPIDAEELRDWLVDVMLVSKHGENILHNQPFETKVSSSSYLSQFFEVVLNEFDAIIRKTYGSIHPGQAYEHYSQFLEMLLGLNVNKIPLFTTNYDLVLESLEEYEGLKWKIETGMERRGTGVTLNTERFSKLTYRKPTIFLFKLHGSTDWWLNKETGKVMQVTFGINPPKVYRELLIYPTREKFEKIHEQPFSFFYNMLDQYLSSKDLRLCIVIGYSFRDKFINEKFVKALRRGLKILIIDPNMDKQKMDNIFPESERDKSINIVNIGFGHLPEIKRKMFSEVIHYEFKNLF